MARTVVWTETARADLQAVAEYIGRDSATYAKSLVRQALSAARSLHRFAEGARVVPEAGDRSYRELFLGHYRLIYRIMDDKVAVIAFIHAARDLSVVWARYEHRQEP